MTLMPLKITLIIAKSWKVWEKMEQIQKFNWIILENQWTEINRTIVLWEVLQMVFKNKIKIMIIKNHKVN
jgi:hypothetical protein